MAARTKPRTGQAATSRCSEDVHAADFHADERHGDTMMTDTERDGLELEKHRREIASIVFKSETLEEISAQWDWRDGDPTTPEGAHTFAARIKAATGRDVRAMFLRNDGDNGVLFAVHDIDLNAATERKERNLDAYRETYAKATAAGITDAAKPADVAFALPIDGSFMFPHNVAEEADNIEKHNRNLLAEIENETRRLRAKIDEAKREEAEAYEPPEVTEARWREYVADAYALVRAEESAKESAKQKSGKGVSRYAGQNFGKYHVHPDGQTITVKGDAVQYKITSAAAIDTLDRLLKGTETQDGWVNWSATDRSRFSTPTAKSFAKKYIENKVERRGFGFDFGHAPQARLKK